MLIADTGPLNYLVLIDCIDILPQLHDRLIIPSAVRRELLSPSAPRSVRSWASHLPAWVDQMDPPLVSLEDPRWIGLHPGETAALALAAAHQPIVLLVDERPARQRALKQGFRVTGTLGVLDQAGHRNLISFAAAIENLKRTTFRYPRRLVDSLLAQHREASRIH